jgi:hypothetical protein
MTVLSSFVIGLVVFGLLVSSVFSGFLVLPSFLETMAAWLPSTLVALLLVLVLDRPVSLVPSTFLKYLPPPFVVSALVCLLVLCTCQFILPFFFLVVSLSDANAKTSGIMLAYFANWGTSIHMADSYNRWVSAGHSNSLLD